MKRTPLKRGNTPLKRTPLKRYTPLRTKKPGKRSEPGSSGYLRWIRTLPCIVCDGAKGPSQAAHTRATGQKPMAGKTSCRSAVPLCPWCHYFDNDSYHQLTPEYRWADFHGLDLAGIVSRLNEAYDLLRSCRKKAA